MNAKTQVCWGQGVLLFRGGFLKTRGKRWGAGRGNWEQKDAKVAKEEGSRGGGHRPGLRFVDLIGLPCGLIVRRVTVHGSDCILSRFQGVRYMFSANACSQDGVYRPKNVPDPDL